MKRSTRVPTVLLFFAALCTVGAYVWRIAHHLPDLTPPVKVTASSALSDGGSVQVVLEDSEGTRALVGLRGSLDVSRENFPVYVMRWYPFVPLPAPLALGSDEEVCFLAKLLNISRSVKAEDFDRAVFNNLVRTVSMRHPQFNNYSC